MSEERRYCLDVGIISGSGTQTLVTKAFSKEEAIQKMKSGDFDIADTEVDYTYDDKDFNTVYECG